MTNREEIEKRFDERFWDLWKLDIYDWWIAVWYVNNNEQIKSFFLDEILPEVLRVLTPCDEYIFNYIKRKAKEKYNITL